MFINITITLIFFALLINSVRLFRRMPGEKNKETKVSKGYKVSVIFSIIVFGFMFLSNLVVLLNEVFY